MLRIDRSFALNETNEEGELLFQIDFLENNNFRVHYFDIDGIYMVKTMTKKVILLKWEDLKF